MGCNQQRSSADSAKTRSWSGIPKTTMSKILRQDLGMKCVMAKFCSLTSAARTEGTSCCSCWWFDSNFYQWTRLPQGHTFEGDWSVIVLYTVFLVSCIFFNKCLCFTYYMAGYLLGHLGLGMGIHRHYLYHSSFSLFLSLSVFLSLSPSLSHI